MSGLAALYHRDGRPLERDAISVMLAAAPYRGPDGMAIEVWDSLALGHAKMAVTPEDAGERQPLVSPASGCAVIADARLDNREELQSLLARRLPHSTGDAELILRAYEAWGVDAVERLLGDFAFVIWDPGRQRLVCARDTSGQRSLFYRIDARTFAAASEIQQLLQDSNVPLAPNDERIREWLVPLNVLCNEQDHAATFFEGIRAVPAGHVLVVGPEGERLQRYWELRPPAELRYPRDEDYAEHYRALFFEVVRARLRSAHPVGVLLSGGLDSSSVAGAAQHLYREGRAEHRGFTAITSTYAGLECDERPFVEDMRALYGFDALYVAPGEFAGRLQLEPRGFRAAPNMGIAGARDAILGAAAGTGARALLTGDIADACVYGSRHVFDSLLRRGDLAALLRHLRAFHRVSGESWRKIALLYGLVPLLPLPLHRRAMSAYLERKIRENRTRLLPRWMPEPMRDDLFRRHLQLCLEGERSRRFSNETREAAYRLLYPPEVARHPAPWALEIWRPFADRRLHEFLLAIPPEQQFAPHPETDEYYAGSKRIVRRAMRGILPESIRMRTSKTVFSAVGEQEIARQWPAFEAAFGPAARPEVARRGYVDQALFWSRLQELRQRYEGGDRTYVMRVVELETWLRALRLGRPWGVTVAEPRVDAGPLLAGGARR
jgi:asparagine synthase (glutamine-hydrolysing)